MKKLTPIGYIEKITLILILIATVFAIGEEIYHLVSAMSVKLSDLLLLFIYAEVVGMVGAFYYSSRIPVTLPIIIAITALSRMIILQDKDIDPIIIVYESLGIILLSISAVIMSAKEKISLSKLISKEEGKRD